MRRIKGLTGRVFGRATEPRGMVALLALSMAVVFLVAAGPHGNAARVAHGTAPAASQAAEGCLACHGNTEIWNKDAPQLGEAPLAGSVHGDLACTDCHTDFDTGATESTSEDPKRVAGMACQNCHAEEFTTYEGSVHGKLALTEPDKGAPTCAGCHGSHGIVPASQLTAQKVCKDCHETRYNSYSDYYHGQPYKLDASDAPACWDCHGTHDVLPATDAASHVAKANLPATCGKCHDDTSGGFTDFSRLIHGRHEALHDNLVVKVANTIFDPVLSLFR